MIQPGRALFTATILIAFIAVCTSFSGMAQEHAGPLFYNGAQHSATVRQASKTTAATLPFFDDFTGYDVYPDANNWTDNQVYINNTMCINPVSRGVATFDALNERGLPWFPYTNFSFKPCDSLTSRPFDFSSYTPGDSIYLSFFYQPKGYGYFPLPADSFRLMMRIRYGDWVTVWRTTGTGLQPFQQVMVPITDTLYFYNGFQFRFVNIAALNFSDAIYNLDYVRMDAHRNMYDTAVNDIAISKNPGYLLNDYTSMPYRQFYPFAAAERAPSIIDSVHNNTGVVQNITYGFTAMDEGTGTLLQSTITNTATLNPWATQAITNNSYTTTVPPAGIYDKVVYRHTHYLEQTTATGPTNNDTIVKEQVFDNYLAYDDGSAEQSYYLSLLPTLPGKLAIEYHLNTPDTLKGLSVYFGRQAPPAVLKTFDIYIYKTLEGIDGASDNVLYVQRSCDPGYVDTINHFWNYRFDSPLPMTAGTFYAGIFLPAESGDDSLYFGLDLNRIGGNHAYYNVLDSWTPSLIHGAIMIRPLLGQNVQPSMVDNLLASSNGWALYPNPATNTATVSCSQPGIFQYSITDATGALKATGTGIKTAEVTISNFANGLYFVSLSAEGMPSTTLKLIKQ
ncbi:MAG: T9SS C-terminal target domain-containing protein [Chitinophagia bacterium]|nr:T9SS C-terminal target domain-containing protein [Chitinophagia bacterium]